MEQLRSLWGRRLSAAEIGAVIGCSRHAVIGKAHRLGLAPIERPATETAPSRCRDKRFPWIRKRRLSQAIKEASELEDIPLTVVGEPRMLSILEINATTCRWPIGDPRKPDFGYCGHPTKSGSAYCDGHHAVAYRPADSEEALLADMAETGA
jgi:GcrA cell cycle regulator